MSDGTTRGTPHGQAPPDPNGASALNGRPEDPAQARTRKGAAESDAEVTRPQPAVHPGNRPPNGAAPSPSAAPSNGTGPSYGRPAGAEPRPATYGQRSASPSNGQRNRPVTPPNGEPRRPVLPPNQQNRVVNVAQRTGNPGQRPASPTYAGPTQPPRTPANGSGTAPTQRDQPPQPGPTAEASPSAATSVASAKPAPGTTGQVPVWDTPAGGATKTSLWDRISHAVGIRDKTKASPEPGVETEAEAGPGSATPVTAFSPAPAQPQAAVATPEPPTQLHPVAPGPQGLTTGAPVSQPAPGQKDDATEQGPPTETLPVVPGPASPSQSQAETLAAARAKVGTPRRTRKARLRLSRLDPWSVMKTSFLFSIAAGIMLVVAVYAVWTVLNTSGLFESVNEIVKSVVSTPGDTTPFRIQEYVNTQKVMGVAALIACVDVVIFTALATLGSFLYNLAATMLGGLEVTLAED